MVRFGVLRVVGAEDAGSFGVQRLDVLGDELNVARSDWVACGETCRALGRCGDGSGHSPKHRPTQAPGAGRSGATAKDQSRRGQAGLGGSSCLRRASGSLATAAAKREQPAEADQ